MRLDNAAAALTWLQRWLLGGRAIDRDRPQIIVTVGTKGSGKSGLAGPAAGSHTRRPAPPNTARLRPPIPRSAPPWCSGQGTRAWCPHELFLRVLDGNVSYFCGRCHGEFDAQRRPVIQTSSPAREQGR